MAAATADAFNLPSLESFTPSYFVAAATTIFANLPVCLDANANLNMASDTSGLKFVGYSQQNINNSGGANGSNGLITCKVTPLQALKYIEIGATNPVQYGSGAWPGQPMYFVDDQNVNLTGGTSHQIKAGICIAVTATGTNGRVIVDVLAADS